MTGTNLSRNELIRLYLRTRAELTSENYFVVIYVNLWCKPESYAKKNLSEDEFYETEYIILGFNSIDNASDFFFEKLSKVWDVAQMFDLNGDIMNEIGME